MSVPDPHAPFAAGFMDDYFAEADEHLEAVRGDLLRLETRLGSQLPVPLLDDLFRSVHSLKGISAMVELREAELLAHHMESCLRAVREREVDVTAARFQLLVDGANLLSEVVAARREGTPMPPIGGAIDALKAFDAAGTTGAADQGGARLPARNAEAVDQAVRIWRVTFVPSPELIERGIKVDAIRTRLLQIGQILAVAPKVSEGGGISFEFHVRTNDERQLAAWREDGLVYEAATPAEIPSEPGGSLLPLSTATVQSVSERPSAAPANFVRVDLARLDDLMRVVSDLVVSRARLDDTLQRVEQQLPAHDWRMLHEHSESIERQLRELREGVMRVRLVPVGEIFRRMPFVVRDLARDSNKRIRLDMTGQTTEIDKFLIERMVDPVLHLVRNAISHGIELPDDRVAAGKPPEGTIRLSASTVGESVIIQVADDGMGIDVKVVAERARASGMDFPDGADGRQLLDVICAPGFSTRDHADRASGRGVGMAVVKTTIQELGGTLSLESEAGRGSTFTVTLPLTLAITEAIIAQVGTHTFAVPQSSVREVVEVASTAVRTIERNELMTYRGATLPMVRLGRLFGIPIEARDRSHAIVIGTGLSAVGLLVDRIVGQREIVVKTIVDPLIRVEGVSGATELGDGRLVLILDVASLSRGLHKRSTVAGGMPA